MVEHRLEKLRAFPIQQGEILSVQYIRNSSEQAIIGFRTNAERYQHYYDVVMLLRPAPGSNIHVEMYLPEPEDWNGRFLGTGNGGYAGEIVKGALLNGLARGFATANTDMGMPKDPDEAMGNMETYIDFGHRSTHLMTVIGKELATWFYDQAPAYSYFMGGSTGGQQAFSEAQRYPEDYDGIVALSPAFDRVNLHTFFVWNWQQICQYENAVFSTEDARNWREALVKVYADDCFGQKEDGYLAFPGGIKGNPMDHPDLQGYIHAHLTEGQKNALRALYDGPVDPVTGEQIIPGFLPGTEPEGLGLADISGGEKFKHDFFYLLRWALGQDFDFMKFDFHRDWYRVREMLSPILDATDLDMKRFRGLGHKLLVIGGSSDPIIPYTGFLKWYQDLVQKEGGLESTKEFCRFFLMPGFAHTFGGNGVQDVGIGLRATPLDADHDAICAVEAWVEQGKAPERLMGTHLKRTPEGLKQAYVLPAYAYPNIAVLKGCDPHIPESYEKEENDAIYEYNPHAEA